MSTGVAADKETARAYVLRAIEEIEQALAVWHDKNQEPWTSEYDRQEARIRLDRREAEFGHQWRNVKLLLEDKQCR